jgi:anti-sigma B factor antagonist
VTRDAEVVVTAAGEVPIAALEGEIDMANAEDLRDSMLEAVTNRAPGLVVDLTSTTYLDSAGIHVVFELARRLHARQQQLRVVVPAGATIRRVLTLTNVSAVAPMHERCDDAVAELVAQADGASPDGSG